MYTISKYTSIVHLSNEKGQTHISGMKAEELLNTFFLLVQYALCGILRERADLSYNPSLSSSSNHCPFVTERH